ncbi:hypothetical protein [Microvirga makkahensis]|uniref:MYXO-CTERM domain-containing protein n=1 Tax=Microvirga makkahensis TaxID=1128670 RepID=A0A7X3MVI1_9HYPH|nr:hypothetical protein [Microvirga makkahensis]MXQ13750.1 hypothetical protein [Microvirga makkahensis]
MFPRQKVLIVAATFCGLVFGSAGAVQGAGAWDPSWAGGGGASGGSHRGAPGPIAGAGLPFLILVGGYVLVRRFRNRGKGE